MGDNSVWFAGGKNLIHHMMIICPVVFFAVHHRGETCFVESLLVMCWCVSSDAKCIHLPLLMMGDNNAWLTGGKNLTCHMFCPVVFFAVHHRG